jgi:hypothetical protein
MMKLEKDPAEHGDVPSTDPMVKLHEFHLQELVLQHLNGRDVMESMKVSQTWNEILSNSPKAMSKIQLKFDERSPIDPSPKEVTKLLRSERRYQNLNLNICFRTNSTRKLLLLQRFSPTLVNLEVYVGSNVKQFAAENLQFPRLKSLSMMGSTNWLLTNDSSLTHLFLNYAHCHQIETAINSLPKLKSFGFSEIFENVKEMKLQPNHTITELKLYRHSQMIVEALVNLEKYKVFYFNRDKVKWIFKNKMKLKELQTGRKVKKICKLYQRLKDSGAAINRNIEIIEWN